MNPRIFVAIAAYRDPELAPTLRSMFQTARDPDRVTAGICWQRRPEDEGLFRPEAFQGRVRALVFDAQDSRGAGWARSIAHSLREEEPFTLQIDSHMRFHRDWDVSLLRLLGECRSEYPVLTTYPAPYEPPDTMTCGTFELAPKQFEHSGILTFAGRPLWAPAPVPTPWLAAGFIFAPSLFFDEVPYDPQVYFIGEELSLAARAWTRGWDLYAPHECVLHHYYGRASDPKHWGDHHGWTQKDAASVRRVKHVLGLGAIGPDGGPLDGPLGLGDVRSLSQYEAFARVDLSAQRIFR